MESARLSEEEVCLETAFASFRVQRLSLGRAAELAALSLQTSERFYVCGGSAATMGLKVRLSYQHSTARGLPFELYAGVKGARQARRIDGGVGANRRAVSVTAVRQIEYAGVEAGVAADVVTGAKV